MNAPAVVALLAVGFAVGVVARSQWKGRKVRFYPVPVPVVRIVRPVNAPAPVVGERAAPKVDLGWERTAVYRFYDDRWALLYVGVAVDPVKRARQHAGLETEPAKPWWSEVAHAEADWFHDRYVALAVEWFAIRYLRPLHNRARGGPDDAYSFDRPDIESIDLPLPSRTVTRARRALRRAA